MYICPEKTKFFTKIFLHVLRRISKYDKMEKGEKMNEYLA